MEIKTSYLWLEPMVGPRHISPPHLTRNTTLLKYQIFYSDLPQLSPDPLHFFPNVECENFGHFDANDSLLSSWCVLKQQTTGFTTVSTKFLAGSVRSVVSVGTISLIRNIVSNFSTVVFNPFNRFLSGKSLSPPRLLIDFFGFEVNVVGGRGGDGVVEVGGEGDDAGWGDGA